MNYQNVKTAHLCVTYISKIVNLFIIASSLIHPQIINVQSWTMQTVFENMLGMLNLSYFICVHAKNCYKLFNVLKIFIFTNEQICQIKASHILSNISGNTSDECWKLLLQNLFPSPLLPYLQEKITFSACSGKHFIDLYQHDLDIRRSKKNQWITNPVEANEDKISPNIDHHLILKKFELSMPYFYKNCCYPCKFSK